MHRGKPLVHFDREAQDPEWLTTGQGEEPVGPPLPEYEVWRNPLAENWEYIDKEVEAMMADIIRTVVDRARLARGLLPLRHEG